MTQRTNHDLLQGGIDDLIAENRAAAARGDRLLRLFRAREREIPDDDPHRLTAREEAVIEASLAWALPASWLRRTLADALWTGEHFPHLADLARRGSIDPYRLRLIAEAARHNLDTDDDRAALVARITPFLARHQREDGLIACTHKQLRNKLSYIVRTLQAADAEARFRNAHRNRDVQVNHGEDGMSWLTLSGTTDQITLAARRLDLDARSARAAGDPRTLAQLRADIAVELVTGASRQVPPAYARPVVNLTVPIQTVMGLADAPGVLSGGQVVPAGLARVIARRPGATWHRMLTDPAGRAIEVSSERYTPTSTIWEQVVAEHSTCFRTGCDHPSTTSDLDHREAWPVGPTSRKNLWPACRTDHRAKHSPGFEIIQTGSGSFALRTPSALVHAITPTLHPVLDDWDAPAEQVQYSATELTLALRQVANRPVWRPEHRPDLAWELGIKLVRVVDGYQGGPSAAA